MKVLCNLGKAKAHQKPNYYYNNFVGYSYYIYTYELYSQQFSDLQT